MDYVRSDKLLDVNILWVNFSNRVVYDTFFAVVMNVVDRSFLTSSCDFAKGC